MVLLLSSTEIREDEDGKIYKEKKKKKKIYIYIYIKKGGGGGGGGEEEWHVAGGRERRVKCRSSL